MELLQQGAGPRSPLLASHLGWTAAYVRLDGIQPLDVAQCLRRQPGVVPVLLVQVPPRSSCVSMRIPLIADTHSRLIADSVPGDRGHPE